MVDISNCRNIVFDSIVFTQTRDDAISMTDVSDISIVNCDFTDIASIAVQTIGTQYAESGRASWQTQRKNGANRVVIKGNNFINIGHTAISLGGSGDVDINSSREFAQTWAAQGGVNRFKLTDDAAEVTFTTPVLTDSTEDKISLSLTYNGEDTKSFTVYVAGYDKEGRLGFSNAHSIKAAKGQSFDIDSIIPDGKLSLCTSFKIFAWKELITPLTGGFINFSKKN